jgi:hypothetical protein
MVLAAADSDSARTSDGGLTIVAWYSQCGTQLWLGHRRTTVLWRGLCVLVEADRPQQWRGPKLPVSDS